VPRMQQNGIFVPFFVSFTGMIQKIFNRLSICTQPSNLGLITSLSVPRAKIMRNISRFNLPENWDASVLVWVGLPRKTSIRHSKLAAKSRNTVNQRALTISLLNLTKLNK
jgi:hypothetical protein